MSSNFIRCPSCGRCIATYIEFFNKAKHAYYTEVLYGNDSDLKDFDPEKLALNPGSTPPLEELLNAIGIKNRCCRIHIMTTMDFDKLYK